MLFWLIVEVLSMSAHCQAICKLIPTRLVKKMMLVRLKFGVVTVFYYQLEILGLRRELVVRYLAVCSSMGLLNSAKIAGPCREPLHLDEVGPCCRSSPSFVV